MAKERKEREDNQVVGPILPEAMFLLVKSDGKMKAISLDNYPDKEDHTKLYLDAIKKYGEENVRYCKVMTTRVKHTIEFIE